MSLYDDIRKSYKNEFKSGFSSSRIRSVKEQIKKESKGKNITGYRSLDYNIRQKSSQQKEGGRFEIPIFGSKKEESSGGGGDSGGGSSSGGNYNYDSKISNPYTAQADALLKQISDMKAEIKAMETPKTIFSGATGVTQQDLQIVPAGEPSKKTGTSSFRRRKTTSGMPNLRTIQSMNV